MRRMLVCLAALSLLAACHRGDKADAVSNAYDTKAAAIDRKAEAQPDETARKIYQAHAAALREEGDDRKKGMEGGKPSSGQGSENAGSGQAQ